MNLPKPPDLGRATDRVLLVDDDPVARLLTASILGQHGFSVIEAGGGREALDRFTPAVNCVLLDALMPGMDGFATCKALRNLPGGGQVPVLMLTGLDDEDSIARAYEAGATDFFVKSSQWTLLAQRTRYLLRASRTRQELEHSRASLARAQRIAKLGTWEWDPRADTIVASEICAEMFGAPHGPGPLAAGRFFDAVHCADQARLHAMLARLVSQPGPQEILGHHAAVLIEREGNVAVHIDVPLVEGRQVGRQVEPHASVVRVGRGHAARAQERGPHNTRGQQDDSERAGKAIHRRTPFSA